ncbi:MAG: lysine 2,3-aminomutase [Bacteroidota bacterium]
MQYVSYDRRTFQRTPYFAQMSQREQAHFKALTHIYHFKVNRYVLENLIDWNQVPNDPVYRYLFPLPQMLAEEDLGNLMRFLDVGLDAGSLANFIAQLRRKVAPKMKSAPSSVPKVNGTSIPGVYQTFESDASLFPHPAVLTCHAYCNYCFRWTVFGNRAMQRNSSYQDPQAPVSWLRQHPEVTDLLITGADPLMGSSKKLRQYILPLLEVEHVKSIDISTKSLAWWPFRFTHAPDADDLLHLFEEVRQKGKHLGLIAHFTHPREIKMPIVARAVERILRTGAVIRTQGPLIKGVNATARTWSEMWNRQITLGMVPFYMFLESDHHPNRCFRIPIAESLRIFREALATSSSKARTVRGPVFMLDLNRVLLDGTTEVNGQKYFVLKTLQAPPGCNSEGDIKLVPYDEQAMDLGNLYHLFNHSEAVPTA